MSLHVHSEYSSLDGWSTVKEIAKRTKEVGCSYCGLTDHGVVAGHIEFDKAMRDEGLKPVFGCLMAGQSIITQTGRKNVEDIEVGDLVLTHQGRFRPVIQTMSRDYQGRAFDVEIAQSKQVLRLTEEHPILIRDIEGNVDWKKPDEIRPTTKWEGGGNLNGEHVCLPKLEDGPAKIEILDWLPDHFEVNENGVGRRKQKKGDRDIFWNFPPMFFLTPEVARFLGLYVAEGSAQKNGHIVFTFHIAENEYAEFVQSMFRSFNINAKIYKRPEKAIQEVVACHVPLALMLRKLCGVGARQKHVPSPIFNSNHSVRQAFLAGVDEGDGKKTSAQKMIKVSSRDLCWGLRVLLADLGFWTSVVNLAKQKHYQIQWSPDRTYRRTKEDDRYLYRMIRDVTPVEIACKVYNFEVAEDNSYVSDFILHNCELYHGVKFDTMKTGERDQAHLIALAMTDEGLKNLWRLVNATADRKRYHHVGRVTCEDIVKYKEGIHFTSACALGLVPQGLLKGDYKMLNWYLDELGDQFSLEVATYPGDWPFEAQETNTQEINELIINVAEERGVMVNYGDDGHFAFPWQWQYHNMYLAKNTKQTIHTEVGERKMYHPPDAVCIKDQNMVRKSLAYLGDSLVDEIIANTHAIGERADAHLPSVDRPHLPVFIPSECPWIPEMEKKHMEKEKMDAKDLFEGLVAVGIEERYAGTEYEQAAWDKALHEIEVLTDDGLEHYFLWTWDIVRYCKENQIAMGPGRGSSAGSIVAYALGITDVDPLYYDLFFERFWNKGRAKGFPDIDSDFARSRRGDIREYLIKRLGEKRVCSIGTVKRMKPLAVVNALRDVCEMSVPEANELKKIIEGVHDLDIHGTDQIGWRPELEPGKIIYVEEDVGEEIKKWIGKDKKRRDFIEYCAHTCSRCEAYGIHPSGIVIADIDLDDYAPAYLRGKNPKTEGIPATQFPMETIEKLMLLKEDVLGLRTLDTISEWEKLMAEKGTTVEWSGLDRQPQADDMWDLLDGGFVAGVFQLETPAGKRLTEQLKPRSIEDLGVIVALDRPGPLRDGVPARYAARKEGRAEVTYPHPILEGILEPTYGLFVYQEQIIRFMWALGYDLGDADQVRKILGKKQPEKLSEIFEGFNDWDKKGFLQVAMENDFTKEVATEVWKTIEGFASYSFNKSHAISYGIVAFRCLYAKWMAPAEWYIACIRTVEHTKRAELTPTYIKEARRKDLKVLPPDIRYSQAQTHVHEGEIYFGFSDITGVAAGGPYVVELRDVLGTDIASPESLVEGLDMYNTVMLEIKKELELVGDLPTNWRSPKQVLNAKKIELIEEAGAWDALKGSVNLKEKQKRELELLNVVLSDNTEEILAANADSLERCDDWAVAARSWAEKDEGDDYWVYDDGSAIPMSKRYLEYKLPGIIEHVKPTKVKKTGASMGIVTMAYERWELSFAVFSNKWSKSKFLFKPHNVGIFTIRQTPTGYHFETGRLLNE